MSFLFQTLRYIAGKRHGMPADAMASAEDSAQKAAMEALSRKDVLSARELLRPFVSKSQRPDLLALQGHLALILGDLEDARLHLARAEAIDPSDPMMLDVMATLQEHLQHHAAEYGYRKRRLLLPDAGARHVVPALKALLDAGKASGQVDVRQLNFLIALFRQFEPVATRDECSRAAELLFMIKAHRDYAMSLVDRSTPPASGCTRVALSLTPPERMAERGGLALHERTDPADPGRVIRALSIPGAGVLPGLQWHPWLPSTREVPMGLVTRRLRTHREEPKSPLLLHSGRHFYADTPSTEPRRETRTAVLVGSGVGYYHFVIDHLSRLAVLDALGLDAPDHVFIVGDSMERYEREYFSLLAIEPQRIVPLGQQEAVLFDRLVVPYPPALGADDASALLPQWARRRLAPTSGATDRDLKLYVSRAKAQRRRISNEDELLQWLLPQGFTVVHLEDLSVAQQIQMFARASHLVGANGAGFTNMIFMAPGARITMFTNRHLPDFAQKLFFHELANACGHTMAVVPGEPHEFSTNRALDADVRINLADLQAALPEGA